MESAAALPKLYNYFRSSASNRVRIALNVKKIKFEYIPVNLVKGDQREEVYTSLNPTKLVPCLEIDGVRLIESLPIIEYLEETRPEPALLPKDPVSKAKVRTICEIVNSGMQPLQNLRVLAKVEELKGDKMAWIQFHIGAGMEALEKFLAGTKGKYCFGDSLTMADLFFHPQIAAATERFGIDLNKFPFIKDIYNNLNQVQEIIDALPKNQPDSPKN